MKRLILIFLVVGTLIGIVIVDTMADPSAVALIDPDSSQQIAADTYSAYNPLDKANGFSSMNSRSSNISELLSLSMIGLTLVGLASFRGGRHKRELK
jgi:hypothetical protein